MSERRKIVCLCGSTRFRREYERAFRDEEHAGRICLTVPCYKSDPCCKSPEEQARLDELHRAKIDLADEVLVINAAAPICDACGRACNVTAWDNSECCVESVTIRKGYIGESTRREIAYALAQGKPVRYLKAVP